MTCNLLIISMTVRLFADDCILYRTVTLKSLIIKVPTDDTKILQQDIDKMYHWELNWQMDVQQI